MIEIIVVIIIACISCIAYGLSQKKRIEELEDQNKFLHSQYMKIKNENEDLKKQLDSRYQVRTFKEDNYGSRYDHVEVKSMKDMYDYNSR